MLLVSMGQERLNFARHCCVSFKNVILLLSMFTHIMNRLF